jgi:hypothetical protein
VASSVDSNTRPPLPRTAGVIHPRMVVSIAAQSDGAPARAAAPI